MMDDGLDSVHGGVANDNRSLPLTAFPEKSVPSTCPAIAQLFLRSPHYNKIASWRFCVLRYRIMGKHIHEGA